MLKTRARVELFSFGLEFDFVLDFILGDEKRSGVPVD